MKDVQAATILSLIENEEKELFHPSVNHHPLNQSLDSYNELVQIIKNVCSGFGDGPEHDRIRCVIYNINAGKEAKNFLSGNSEMLLGNECTLASMESTRKHASKIAIIADETEMDKFMSLLEKFDPPKSFQGMKQHSETVRKYFGNFRIGIIDGIHRMSALKQVLCEDSIPSKVLDYKCSAIFSAKKADTSIQTFLDKCTDLSFKVKDALMSGVDHTIHDAIAAIIDNIKSRNTYILKEKEEMFYSLLLSPKKNEKRNDDDYSESEKRVLEILTKHAIDSHQCLMKVREYKEEFLPKKSKTTKIVAEGYAESYSSVPSQEDAQKYIFKKTNPGKPQLKKKTGLNYTNYYVIRLTESALMSDRNADELMRAFRNISNKSRHNEISYEVLKIIQYHAGKIAKDYVDKIFTKEKSSSSFKGRQWKKKNLERFISNQMQTQYIMGVSFWYDLKQNNMKKVTKLILGDSGGKF